MSTTRTAMADRVNIGQTWRRANIRDVNGNTVGRWEIA